MSTPLRFHWSLSQAGDNYRRSNATARLSGVPDLGAQIELCRCADRNGIDSMLMAIGFTRPDPMLLTATIGQETERVSFMVACRAGLISPTMFVQQINTLSALLGGRICINIVGGHTPQEQRYYGDFLAHDERYERTGEFLSVCRAFWADNGPVNFAGKYYTVENGTILTPFMPGGGGPEIFVGGNSRQATDLAIAHGACLWRFAEAPGTLPEKVAPLLEHGVEIGLLMGIIARHTREEAVAAAYGMLERFDSTTTEMQRAFVRRTDSVAYNSTYDLATGHDSDWLTSTLWSGAVPYMGAPSMALVGSALEVAEAIMEYRRAGITQFLFLGWPDIEEMEFFGSEVLPLVRRMESIPEPSEIQEAR